MTRSAGYLLAARLSRQDDGLWRVEVPALPGAFVDAPTVEQALSEIQEVAAMVIDLYQEEQRSFPPEVREIAELPALLTLPVVVAEHSFRRITRPKKPRAGSRSALASQVLETHA
ncbi:MAG: type II toxin-antitoxin system HicB family antitoxin [Chloroflexi bacterium]|nr:type II toxin-antitoxin system HicB family antitoxin [Chloroflexota bacterium]